LDKKEYHLYIKGQKISVSEEIYKVYARSIRKERYMTEDLKASHLVIDGEHIVEIPSREDSYDRLLEMDKQFPDVEEPLPEDITCKAHLLERLE